MIIIIAHHGTSRFVVNGSHGNGGRALLTPVVEPEKETGLSKRKWRKMKRKRKSKGK
jgi:hypothetical protein